MEISQFTYFQQVGGIEVKPVASEITYGLERLAMFIQKIENVYDLDWDGIDKKRVAKHMVIFFYNKKKNFLNIILKNLRHPLYLSSLMMLKLSAKIY